MYSNKLKNLRESANLTQKDIADMLLIDRVGYTQYETEYAIIPPKHLNTICNYFDVSFDYIFSFSNLKKYLNAITNLDNHKSGERLKEFRKENRLTQKKLADSLNTNQSVIANYERGRTIIATPFLYTICSKYHISADYLLGKVDKPKYLK